MKKKGGSRKKTGISGGLVCLAVVVYLLAAGRMPGNSGTSGQVMIRQTEVQQENVKQTAARETEYTFRTEKQFEDHYEKHGIDMGYDTPEEYLIGANNVIASDDALHKLEEDGDDIYYLESTNEFVVLSEDDYIRTYFEPDDGIQYYYRQ